MTPAQFALWLSLAAPPPDFYGVPGVAISYAPIVQYWADVNLVPRFLAAKIIREESHFKPDAKSYEWEQDRHGRWYRTDVVVAEGLAMVTVTPKDRADHVTKAGMTLAEFDPMDASDSLRVGMAFMGRLLVRFGYEVRPATAGYNAGAWGAAQWWEGRSALPIETRNYLRKVLG